MSGDTVQRGTCEHLPYQTLCQFPGSNFVLRAIDRQKDFEYTFLGFADLLGDPGKFIFDLFLADRDIVAVAASDGRTPADIGPLLPLDRAWLDPKVAQERIQLTRSEIVPLLDHRARLGKLLLRDRDVQSGGFLQLKLFVNKGPQHLRGQPLGHFRRVWQPGGDDHHSDPLAQILD